MEENGEDPADLEEFATLGLDVLMEGGLVDFVMKVIIKPSFQNNECLWNVFTTMGGLNTFSSYLQPFEGEIAHLIRSASENHNDFPNPNVNAITKPPLNNNNIEIKFNINNLGRPALDVARTLVHEMIHATIFRWMLIAAKTGALMPEEGMSQQELINYIENLRIDFPGIYDYYYKRHTPEWQHEQMAVHFVPIIVSALKEFDDSFDEEVYEALSWVGLKNTISWNNLNEQDQNNFNQIRVNFLIANENCE